MIACPNPKCQLPQADDASFCPKCSERVQTFCPVCGGLTETQHQFCRHCQTDLRRHDQLSQKGKILREQYRQIREERGRMTRRRLGIIFPLIFIVSVGLGAAVASMISPILEAYAWSTFIAGLIAALICFFLALTQDEKDTDLAFLQAFNLPIKNSSPILLSGDDHYGAWVKIAARVEEEKPETNLLRPAPRPPDNLLLQPVNGANKEEGQ